MGEVAYGHRSSGVEDIQPLVQSAGPKFGRRASDDFTCVPAIAGHGVCCARFVHAERLELLPLFRGPLRSWARAAAIQWPQPQVALRFLGDRPDIVVWQIPRSLPPPTAVLADGVASVTSRPFSVPATGNACESLQVLCDCASAKPIAHLVSARNTSGARRAPDFRCAAAAPLPCRAAQVPKCACDFAFTTTLFLRPDTIPVYRFSGYRCSRYTAAQGVAASPV